MYEPVAVDAPVYAKKIYRKKVLEGYVDSLPGQVVRADRWSELMEIPYETRVAVPEGWDDAYIDALVSVEGCASCGIIDTLFVAKLRQSEPVDTFSLQWIRPTLAKRPKVMEGKGIAVLQFTINRSDIDGSLGDNRAELEKMAKTLRPILEDSLASVQLHTHHRDGICRWPVRVQHEPCVPTGGGRRSLAARQDGDSPGDEGAYPCRCPSRRLGAGVGSHAASR